RVEHVRGRDEEYLRQVEGYVQVVIAEGGVLLGIERFQKSRRRIATKIAAYLVDFVQHEDRIVGLGAANALDDLPGQRSNVGPPVTANFRFVMHAAQGQTHELASQGSGNGLAE